MLPPAAGRLWEFTKQAGTQGYPEQDEFPRVPYSLIREAKMKEFYKGWTSVMVVDKELSLSPKVQVYMV